MSKTRWKFLREVGGKIKSDKGDCTWEIGEWKKEDKVDMCNKGFHCSKKIIEAFSYVQGEILAKVEVNGESDRQEDKEVYSDMRIVKLWKWDKKDSVALSIFASELCLENYEKLYPEDRRPREAINAAKKVMENDTEENRSAAENAAESAAENAGSAAESARSARSAAENAGSAAENAWSAARSAESAARSAESAAWSAGSARSAARSAWSASWSAESAAWSAAESASWSAWSAAWSAWSAGSARSAARSAESAAYKKIENFMVNRIKSLTEIK